MTPFSYRSTRRVLKAAADQIADLTLRLVDSARELLLEHARDHVKRTGALECPTCKTAGQIILHADDAARGLLW